MSTGRWLQSQDESVQRLEDGTATRGIFAFIGGAVVGPQVNPGPSVEAKTSQPLINPGPGETGKIEGPLVNPGPNTKAATDQPLINPGPGPSKVEGPLVLPGSSDGKALGPLINPGEPNVEVTPAAAVATALQALAGDGRSQSVTALVQAAQQAVSRAPVSTMIAAAAEVAPDAETPEPTLDPALVDAEPGQTAPAAPQGAVTAPAALSTSTGTGPSDATGQTNGTRTGPSEVSDAHTQPLDTLNTEPDVRAAPLRAEVAAPVEVVRADAATVAGRMSFDALAQVSAQIIRRLEARTTRFDMELNPVELGRVDVRLDIDSEGRLAARLAFDNPAAALDLRGRVDDLRRELQQAGFQLADDAFSFADRGGSGGGRGSDADDARRAHARSAEAADQVDIAAQPALRKMTRLGLDVRV